MLASTRRPRLSELVALEGVALAMKPIVYDQKSEIDIAPFSALVGEDIVSFIFEHAPRKVLTRVARARPLCAFAKTGKY